MAVRCPPRVGACRTKKAAFDAGYDREENHRLAREELRIPTLIPPLIGRPTKKPATRWRQHMKRVLATPQSRRRSGYTQRWQAETVMSMIKRNLGSALRGKTARSRHRDLALKVLTHNVMIFRRHRGSRQWSPRMSEPSSLYPDTCVNFTG
jgi:hypothetical protein